MGKGRELGQCILCDAAMVVRRSLAREEPTLLCIACRQRSEAERTALREASVARRRERDRESATPFLRPAMPLAGRSNTTVRAREATRRNALRDRVATAFELGELARLEGARRLVLARWLMLRFDDFARHARGALRPAEATRNGNCGKSAS